MREALVEGRLPSAFEREVSEAESYQCPNQECSRALFLVTKGVNIHKWWCRECDKGWTKGQLQRLGQ
jgi:ribosomal protein L37AE/L43A